MTSRTTGTSDYVLCGWRVRSAVPLPEAMPWCGDDRAPDVTIRFGSAPALIDPVGKVGLVQIGRDGACRLEVAGIGCFLVLGGREVTIERRGDFDRPESRGWLLGEVLGILCHQRELFPLHAACIRIGEGAVALTGRSGAGKSTLAAALVRRGHTLVADDVCVIDPAARDGVRVLPSFPRLKLSQDALQALYISADGMARAGFGKRKYHFCQPGSFDPSSAKLAAIYVLDRSMARDDIRPESGTDAAVTLSSEIFRRGVGYGLGHKVALMSALFRIAATAPVFRLPVPSDLSQLGSIAARAEAHFTALHGSSRGD